MAEQESEPEYWTYELVGGPCDGHKGRSTKPRVVVNRPSTVDPSKIHVYHLGDIDLAARFALYKHSHDGFTVLATESDPDS